MTKHIIAIITLLGAISIGAYANGDPVIEHSAMTVSRTPVSRQIPEIQVTYERLDITPADLYTHITVLYRLHNTSRKNLPLLLPNPLSGHIPLLNGHKC